MKDTFKFIGMVLFSSVAMGGVIIGAFELKEYRTPDKQHIKTQRVGCHQYRINEFTNEVQHLEGCNNPQHLGE